ncbi:LysR substrate-binding domain-containing protein [Roseovarius arcticus]|uniref:LysR substrate-binding domain-containing protein n=1 Tax=Roseovarius arcticus TaxID=2547404 RepID=UPI0011101E49|nr:LysR substrate-binding domain-containing protein [Roseovarius arcticus]
MQNHSLNGLRMFEAAARHLSFTVAASELNVTQAAVSQQIRRLEDELGVKLFLREKGGLALSVSGQDLAKSTNVALSMIKKSTDRITDTETGGVLAVSTLASFASRWLIPRLSRFQEKHPDIALHVHTSGTKVDFDRDGIDAAIRLAAKKELGLHDELIMQDSLCLVASADVAKAVGDIRENLYKHPLIIDGSRLLDENSLDLTGLATEQAMELLKLDKMKLDFRVYKQSDSVVLAALAGQGVALTRSSLCSGDLETGRLALVCNFRLPLEFGYSLVWPESRAKDPKLLAFKRWMMKEVADLQDAGDCGASMGELPP